MDAKTTPQQRGGARPGAGRPKKSASDQARCRTYRLTDIEAGQLSALAAHHGLSDSRMLAKLITDSIKNKESE